MHSSGCRTFLEQLVMLVSGIVLYSLRLIFVQEFAGDFTCRLNLPPIL